MIGRFATLALAMLSASAVSGNPFVEQPVQSKKTRKASFVSKVMSKATPLRRLDEEEQEVDLSPYSLHYVKCQFVKAYDDEMAEDEEAGTVLMTNRFVIFRLCPSSSCAYNYGEYLVDMDTYLEAAVQYQQEEQENMCKYCEEVCANDDDANRRLRRLEYDLKVDCDTCVDECEAIENMEENGYMDASNFIECQQVGEDDDGTQYFAGAMCTSDSEIKIGIFNDEYCSQKDSSASLSNYLEGATLNYDILKAVYSQETSISCIKEDWEVPEDDDGNGNQNQDEEEEEVEINEMCRELYEGAAKCESKYGFQSGVDNYAAYENQANQEELVCSFIKTLSSGAYDQSGEIVLKSKVSAEEGATATTGGQKFALAVFVLGTVGFTVYAAQLHSQLTSGGASGMGNQGGAMA
jgi:hypothetical protein